MGSYDDLWMYCAKEVIFQEFLNGLLDGFYTGVRDIVPPLLETFKTEYSESYFNNLVDWHFKGGKASENFERWNWKVHGRRGR